ncbi:MAG: hypothetical protein E7055_10290 [Lentisphaerae bacterium]|nr:hypothetical protein [Lentisphaerota bacterium]
MAFGDSGVVLRALEQYAKLVPAMAEQYEFIDFCNYGTPVSADVYGAADIVMFSFYRHYGVRWRAEGIPALENRMRNGKKGILYDFENSMLIRHPLVWVIPGEIPLSVKLHDLFHTDDLVEQLASLRQSFQKDIFPIDGHRK